MRNLHSLLFFLLFSFSHSYKILIYNPKFGFSHVNFMGRIADTLVEAGHQVTVLQPIMMRNIESNGSTKAELIQVHANLETQLRQEALADKLMKSLWDINPHNPYAPFSPFEMFFSILGDTCEKTLNNKKVMDYLAAKKFDIGITEICDYGGFAYFHHIGLKNIVGAHSTNLLETSAYVAGVPMLPSFVPSSMSVVNDDGSFYSRAVNTFSTFMTLETMSFGRHQIQKIMNKKYGAQAPDIHEIMANITWYVINSEPLFDYPVPTYHTIVEIGGIGVRPAKPVDKYWDKILSLREKTVLFSFGSVVPSSMMSDEMKKHIVQTFARFPEVTFIWKYENPEDNIADNVENVVLTAWTPQHDLLADPRLTAFMTHGGAGSMRESATYGKPLVVMPVWGDQMRNAYMVTRLGMGIYFDKRNLAVSDHLYNAIHQLLTDQSLYTAAQRTKALIENTPFSYKEKLLKTINLAGKFGHLPQLRPTGASLNFVQYHNLDVYFVAFSLVSIFLYLIGKLAFWLYYNTWMFFYHLIKDSDPKKKTS